MVGAFQLWDVLMAIHVKRIVMRTPTKKGFAAKRQNQACKTHGIPRSLRNLIQFAVVLWSTENVFKLYISEKG